MSEDDVAKAYMYHGIVMAKMLELEAKNIIMQLSTNISNLLLKKGASKPTFAQIAKALRSLIVSLPTSASIVVKSQHYFNLLCM